MPRPTSSAPTADRPLSRALEALSHVRAVPSRNGAFSPDNLALAAVVAGKELRAIVDTGDEDLARERAGELLLTVVQLVDALELDPDQLLKDALARYVGLYERPANPGGR